MNLRKNYLGNDPELFAEAVVNCVLAAAEVQDRRIDRDRTAIIGRQIAADAHLGGFARMDAEQRAAAGRKGGLVRKAIPAEELARREAARAACRARVDAVIARRNEILRLRSEDRLSITAIALKLGVSRSLVAGVVHRHGEPGVIGQPAAPKGSPIARYGFTLAEFEEWGRLRAAYGYTSDEAAQILLRSRRPASTDGAA